jgi:hypothetical protein
MWKGELLASLLGEASQELCPPFRRAVSNEHGLSWQRDLVPHKRRRMDAPGR